jgi:hypothetical protein
MLLTQTLPDVAAELVRGFRLAERTDLAEQIQRLELVGRCPCGDELCTTFYTQPNESWERKLVDRFVLAVPGLVCLHTVNGVVARVELPWRPEVRARLCQLFP